MLKFKSAYTQLTNSKELIPSLLHMDNLRIRVWFGVGEDLALNVLLGILSIEEYLRDNFPAQHTHVLLY